MLDLADHAVVATSSCGDDTKVVVVAVRVGDRCSSGGGDITDEVAHLGDKADTDGVLLVVAIAPGV